ncbi:hypothetical protein OVY01_13735 [Robbsia sp. Bb-Pol-6]|uniref:Uncharacterized protein n=1 Tax=Robbsia betulipollinis TaxID=2981849 RepID=A0ABT3ZPS5_9BURK|nr:hypothetical protein [Robbsia betulipollinis]MCY0388277.1 hypothetical protein [Robbsia betulipollinis]
MLQHIACTDPVSLESPRAPYFANDAPLGSGLSISSASSAFSYAQACIDVDWGGLDANEKTGRGLACALVAANVTMQDAIEQVRASRHWSIAAWRAGNTSVARAAAWRDAPETTRTPLRTLTRLAALVERSVAASGEDVVARARTLLQGAHITFDNPESLYARQLWLDVDDWLDLRALAKRRFSPVELLGHAYRWCGLDLATDLSPRYLPLAPFDHCAVDLAALLHAKTRGAVPGLTALTDFTAPRAAFDRKLRHDLCVRARGAALVTISGRAPPARGVWFDGVALHGAAGMNLTALARHLAPDDAQLGALHERLSRAVQAHCRPAARARAALEELLRKRFKVLQESTDYPFGTPHQSLATILLRLGPLHGVDVHNVGDPEALLQRYQALETAWHAAPRYPVAPHLAAAFHLAQSRDVLLHDDSRSFEAQLIARVRQEFESRIDTPRMRPFVSRWLAERHLALWHDLPRMVHAAGLASAPFPLREAAREYRRLEALPERLAVAPGAAGATALGTYLADGVMAYGAVPVRETLPPHEVFGIIREIGEARLRERQRLHRHAAWRRHDAVPAAPRRRRAASADGAELAHGVLHAVTRVLIVPHLVEQSQEPDATALDFVPLLGSAYTLGKGLWQRDAKQALRGAFAFGLDILFIWVGGATERIVARRAARLVSEVGLTPHEPRALAMLSGLGDLLDVAHPGELPAGNVRVNVDACAVERVDEPPSPFPRTGPSANSPKRGPASAVSLEHFLTRRRAPRSRAGEPEPLYGPASASRPPHGSIVQFALREPLRMLLRASSDETPSGPGAGGFLERATVAKARDFVQTRDFIEHIRGAAKSETAPRVSDLLQLDAGADTRIQDDFRTVHAVLQGLCERSQTLRALLRAALNANANGARRFTLRFMNASPPKCDLQNRLIVLPPVAQPLEMRYVDARGLTPFQHERAWLHEFVHALTGIEDVSREERMGHRGAVVYFTDRILFEAGPELPERVMYQHAKGAFASGHARLPDPVIDAARQEAAETALAEDTFLDTLLRRRMQWGGTETILGTPVERRLTVEQVVALRREIDAGAPAVGGAGKPPRRAALFASLRHFFQVSVAGGDALADAIARGARLTEIVGTLYREDDFFCFLMNRWQGSDIARPHWKVRWEAHRETHRETHREVTPAASAASGMQGWSIDRGARRLVFHETGLFYASQRGPRLLEEDRRLVGALVELVTPAAGDVPAHMASRLNRGLRVYLENRGMALLRPTPRGDPDPPQRISAEWHADAAAPWPSLGKARRAAEAEDAWLARNAT